MTPKESELCLQWYQPSLEESGPNNANTPFTRQILLLYALNISTKKVEKMATSLVWVTLPSLLDLHDR